MLEARKLTKIYRVYERPRHWLLEKLSGKSKAREIVALYDVSFQVEKGECLGVVGGNGAGKTTLLKVLAGISRPSAGMVEAKGRISAVLELDSGFHPEFTGRENLRIGAAIHGLSLDKSSEEEVIAFSGLGDFIDLPVRTYSTGMYLRLGFSLATALQPEIFLVDEALAVGDEWFRGKCIERIREMKSAGATIVIASHDLSMVRALCDRALLLKKGRLAAQGEPKEVINSYLEFIYEEAAANAEPSPFPSERPRRGTGELEIKAVRMKGPEGKPTSFFKTGEPMIVEFDFLAHEECPSPLFGVNIFSSEGALAICVNSETAWYSNRKFRPGEPPGDHPEVIEKGRRGTARFVMERNPLLEGTYELCVNIYKGKSGAAVAVDEILGAMVFKVASGDHLDRGLFLTAGRWEIR